MINFPIEKAIPLSPKAPGPSQSTVSTPEAPTPSTPP